MGDGGVAVNKLREYAAEGLNAEAQGRYVEKKNVFDFAAENTALNCSTDCNTFIGVNALEGFFAGNVLYKILNCGNTG